MCHHFRFQYFSDAREHTHIGPGARESARERVLPHSVVCGFAVTFRMRRPVQIEVELQGGSALFDASPTSAPRCTNVECNWTVIDPWSLRPWPSHRMKHIFVPHDLSPWASARRRLRANEHAVLLASSPDIWVIPNLFRRPSSLVDLARSRWDERLERDPPWCFANYPETAPAVAQLPSSLLIHFEEPYTNCTTDTKRAKGIARALGFAFSSSAVVEHSEEVVTDEVGAIIESETGLETSRGAAYQLLSYGAGDSYSPHVDCASSLTYGPPTEVEARRYYDDHTTGKRRQRAATVLLYLESTADGDAGGYTCFPRRSLCVRPRRGAAVLFQSLDAVYRCDHGSEHLSTAMVGDNARKVVLQRWYYNLHLTKLLHGGGRDVVFCDRLRNCRHYFH